MGRVDSEGVESGFELSGGVEFLFSEGVKNGHKNPTIASAFLGLRAVAYFSGDDDRSDVSFSPVVVGRDGPVVGPEVESETVVAEYVLKVTDGLVLSVAVDGQEDVLLDLCGLEVEHVIGNVH